MVLLLSIDENGIKENVRAKRMMENYGGAIIHNRPKTPTGHTNFGCMDYLDVMNASTRRKRLAFHPFFVLFNASAGGLWVNWKMGEVRPIF